MFKSLFIFCILLGSFIAGSANAACQKSVYISDFPYEWIGINEVKGYLYMLGYTPTLNLDVADLVLEQSMDLSLNSSPTRLNFTFALRTRLWHISSSQSVYDAVTAISVNDKGSVNSQNIYEQLAQITPCKFLGSGHIK